jgi:hypothetical protein
MNFFVRFAVRAALSFSSAACLLSCSSTKLFTSEDPGANFDTYVTYGFSKQLGTDEEGYGTIVSEFLKAAASRELEARGYKPSPAPDLLINFRVQTREQLRATQTPAPGFYGYRSYGTWNGYIGSQTTLSTYTEGTLNVDLIDHRRGQLIWEATMIGRISDAMRRDLRATIDEAMAEVFESYPHRAGSRPLPPIENTLDVPTLLRLAEQGLAVAQMNLALLYLRGAGVEESPQTASLWMRRAANQGFFKAQVKLASMYEHGRGVPLDLVAAYMWSHVAAQNGEELGREQREALRQRMTAESIAEAELRAAEWMLAH